MLVIGGAGLSDLFIYADVGTTDGVVAIVRHANERMGGVDARNVRWPTSGLPPVWLSRHCFLNRRERFAKH